MSKKGKAAGSGHSTAAKVNSSKSIIAEPIDIVNSDESDNKDTTSIDDESNNTHEFVNRDL